ncbi:membrane protein [Mesobacillus campisalis]|uniref:Membrane protein n=1 Tax=Mesobacillus campisalis TaxID=1408103 RepID=A0A0M2ST62_9BACI|nr:DUF421 domain-containing protein [Mesobacillus campisalis]KKK36182.1 membrane protein [Mesobacillus campisalis]
MYWTILFEVIGGFFILYIIVRLLGKTQISQITPFDFVSALVLGELVGNAMYDPDTGFGVIIFTSGIWGVLIYVTEIMTQKSIKMRRFLEGKPSILIQKGNLNWYELKKNHLDIDQLQQLLRAKDVFSMQEVDYAILENNGSVSVLRKAEADQPTCRDLNIQAEERKLPYTIISDGEIMNDSLREAGVNEAWIMEELEKQGVMRPEEICYAEYIPGNGIYFQRY